MSAQSKDMKTTNHLIYIIFTLQIIFSSQAQKQDCSQAKLYNLVFQEMKLYEKKAATIEIGYTPDEYIIGLIKEMKLLNPNEIKANKAVDQEDYLACKEFRNQIALIEDKSLIKENGQYYVFYFSKIISLSDTKKCILFHNGVRSTKYEGGKAMGGEILCILEKDDNTWVVKEKKLIVTY